MNTWTVGETGFYFLPRSPRSGRSRDLYLAIRVISTTKTRVVVRPQDGRGGHRILLASSLVREAPAGAWIK